MRNALRFGLIATLILTPALAVLGTVVMTAPASPPGAMAGVIVHGVAANPRMVPAGGTVLVDGIGRNLGVAAVPGTFVNR